MDLIKQQLYLLEHHSELFKIWTGIIRINTEGKSLIMKLGPRPLSRLLQIGHKQLVFMFNWVSSSIETIQSTTFGCIL